MRLFVLCQPPGVPELRLGRLWRRLGVREPAGVARSGRRVGGIPMAAAVIRLAMRQEHEVAPKAVVVVAVFGMDPGARGRGSSRQTDYSVRPFSRLCRAFE
ncbi:unnamed protein product [Pylaiella littoralis]